MFMLKKLHHAAYRCKDAAETVDFYANGLGMKFAATMINHVPSTGLKASSYTHLRAPVAES